MRRVLWGLVAIGMLLALHGMGQTGEGEPPTILFVDFPSQIEANGQLVTGFVAFHDPDGDVVRADFEVVEAEEFSSFSLELADELQGKTDGVIEFRLSSTRPQRVVLQVILHDAAGHASEPKEFAFEVVASGSPPVILAIDFPEEIRADGTSVPGLLAFRDPDGDVVAAEFQVVEAQDFQPFRVERDLRGQREGVLEFQIATAVAQRVVLAVTLVDEAEHRSEPAELRFEAVAEARSRLSVSPLELRFAGRVSGAEPPAQALTVQNAGGGTLNWQAFSDVPWLSLRPTEGSLAAGEETTLSVEARPTGLAVGVHQGRITIQAEGVEGSPQIIPVTLEITSPSAQFQDDFSDPRSGWATWSNEWGEVRYENGEYSIRAKARAGHRWGHAPPSWTLNDFTLELEARHVDGPRGEYGVIFRHREPRTSDPRDWGDFYLFALTTQGRYALFKVMGRQWTPLVDYRFSPVIETSPQWNRIRITAVGSQIRVEVNGQELLAVQDGSLSSGRLILFVNAFEEQGGTHAHFDNLRIWSP